MGMNCEDDALKIEKQIDEEYNQSIFGENSPKNLQQAIEIMVESFHKYSKEELERQSRNIDLEMVFAWAQQFVSEGCNKFYVLWCRKASLICSY